jgi:hypothetical protein
MRNIVSNAFYASALLIGSVASANAAMIYDFDLDGRPHHGRFLSGTAGLATIGLTAVGAPDPRGKRLDVEEGVDGWLLNDAYYGFSEGQSEFVSQGLDVRNLHSRVFGNRDLPNGLRFSRLGKFAPDSDLPQSATSVPEARLALLMLVSLVPVFVRARRAARIRR